ncbi:hypothetical protein PLESTB_001105300 [Pleodorina starrii]|uniref:Origin recognition complex subunit 6 n=1 Tax=Pleodorina starrii TaxID=330485 RepID=A0A9W6F4Q5_9CHLO|nr:hypothetical protein PLESTB_001105300 [Pleodorina starrii]
MDIKQLARSLGVTQQPAISRATELLRLLKLKVPGSLGQGEICRPAVCLELACQTTPGSKLPVRDEFIRYSCSAPKVYNEMFTRIQRLLDVRPALELRELVTLFGCSQLHDNTQQLLRTYKSRVLDSLSESERARADLTRPALLAAAFLLTAKKARAKVDRSALLAKMGLTRAELATALEDFAARCEDKLAPPASSAAAGSRKRGKGDEGPQTDAAEGADDAGQSEPGPSNATARGGGKRRRGGGGGAAQARGGVEEERGRECAAEAVAVDDFKLVLIGLGAGPAGEPAGGAAEGGDDEPGAAAAAGRRRGPDRPGRKARAGKGREGVGKAAEVGRRAAGADDDGGDDDDGDDDGGDDSDGGRGTRRQRRRL